MMGSFHRYLAIHGPPWIHSAVREMKLQPKAASICASPTRTSPSQASALDRASLYHQSDSRSDTHFTINITRPLIHAFESDTHIYPPYTHRRSHSFNEILLSANCICATRGEHYRRAKAARRTEKRHGLAYTPFSACRDFESSYCLSQVTLCMRCRLNELMFLYHDNTIDELCALIACT